DEANFSDWWEAVGTAVDEYIAMHRTVPGFRTLHFGDVVDIHLLDDERDNNAVIASHLVALLAKQFSISGGERLEFALAIAVETVDALVKMAFRREPDGDPAVLDEAKSLIKDYLHHRLALTRAHPGQVGARDQGGPAPAGPS